MTKKQKKAVTKKGVRSLQGQRVAKQEYDPRHIKHKFFDKDLFESLCKKQVKTGELVSRLGFSKYDSLYKAIRIHYEDDPKEVILRFKLFGQSILRETQFNVAIEEQNVQMLKFLGEQYLEQSSKQLTVHQVEAIFQQKSDEEIKQALDKLEISEKDLENL